MESEDESELYNRDRMTISHPWMQLYEEEEKECRQQQSLLRNELLVGEQKETTWDHHKLYIVLRFFGTLKGFHKGSLDLTGRHPARYASLLDRWSKFQVDLREVSSHATRFETLEENWDGEMKTMIDYRFVNPDIWHKFQETWHLPQSASLTWLLAETERTQNVLSVNPAPKFQETCLLSLPTELLESVMDHASMGQARVLSATCHHLRQIGLKFIFGRRTLKLEANPDWKMLRAEHDIDHFEHLRDAALISKSIFLETTDFLISRPDLTQSLQTLLIQNQWSNQALRGTLAEDFDIRSVPKFYSAIRENVTQILQKSPNLQNLSFTGMNIVPQYLQIITNITSLQTVSFHMCRLNRSALEGILAGGTQLSDSVLNLDLFVDEIGVVKALWILVALFPRLRTLSVMGSGVNTTGVPPQPISQLCNPFATLERLYITHFNANDVPTLNAWIVEAASKLSSSTLKLTHFKIHTDRGMADEAVFELLSGLQLCPDLHTLVLDGLRDAELELIDRIGYTCPNLLGLTLIRRHNDRQTESKPALWPYTSAEYASRFTIFTRLLHFSWNIRIDSPRATPSIMQQFEEGFPDTEATKGWETMKEEDAGFYDDYLIAGPFAAHCPTLRSFAIGCGRSLDVFNVDRTEGGYPLVKSDWSSIWQIMRKWNPPFCGWPPIELRINITNR